MVARAITVRLRVAPQQFDDCHERKDTRPEWTEPEFAGKLANRTFTGAITLDDLKSLAQARAAELGLEIDFRQSNSEGELVDWIQEAKESADGIVINAGAYTHTSVAILDALVATELPVVEVHLSNLFKREAFRHHSYISPVAAGLITGFGPAGVHARLGSHVLDSGRVDVALFDIAAT